MGKNGSGRENFGNLPAKPFRAGEADARRRGNRCTVTPYGAAFAIYALFGSLLPYNERPCQKVMERLPACRKTCHEKAEPQGNRR